MTATRSTNAQPARQAKLSRTTRETAIDVEIDLESALAPSVATGLPFFDHMLEQLGKHGGFSLVVKASGDLHVDAHHTVEDVGILLGETFAEALGDKAGIRRFSSLSLPLDEALVDVALDLSGRAFLHYDVDLGPEAAALGNPPFDPQLAEEFWRAFVHAASATLHISLRYGRNSHHVLEASFKAVARTVKDAVRIEGTEVPSTKGVL